MSLLIGSGYTAEVQHWPLSMIADEVSIVVERENLRIASEAITLQAAAASVITGQGDHFDKVISALLGE